jgi:hypothetical protein
MGAKKPTVELATTDDIRELDLAESALRDEFRDLALADLWFFATEILFAEAASTHYYEPLHKPVCEWVGTRDKGARKLLLMPRGHRKTYLVTIAHAVWRILNDPNVRIILVSALDDTAQHFCQMIKRQFQYNEHFLSYFPEFRVSRNQQFGRTYDFTHPKRSDTANLIDPTFRSFYLGAPVAGRRCDILIADDPIEKKHVTTPEQADKSLKDFNDLIPIVDKTGAYNQMFVVGTRWAFNDIYGAMLGEARGDEVDQTLVVVNRFDATVRHCLEDDDGKPVTNPRVDGAPILPNVWSRETLLQELEQYKMDPKRGEEDWWKQYMNVCMSPAGRKFEEEYFDTWIPSLPGGIVFSMFLCDSATKDEQILMRGDYTVVHAAHFDAYGHLYLTDAFRSDRMKGMDLIEQLIAMNQRGKQSHGISITNFVKEKVGEDTFFGWIRSEFNRARLPLTIFPVNVRGQGRKYVRIVEALQHPAMARQIHFVDTYPREVHRVLVDEAIHLGQWSHDDTIDALSLAFHPLIRRSPRNFDAQEWHVPNTRLPQLSTPAHNPSASWTTPTGLANAAIAADGRYGNAERVDGFRVHRYTDRGETQEIDSTSLTPKRMFIPGGSKEE